MVTEFSMLIAVVVVFIVTTFGLVLASRRFIRTSRALTGTEDIEGIYITVLGSIYAIFIAFMVFVVWTRFEAATQEVEHEASVLVNLYRLVQALPEPYEDQLEQDLRDYVNAVVNEEWPAMASHDESAKPVLMLNQLWKNSYQLTRPESTWSSSVVTDHLLTQVGELSRIRQSRLLHARQGIPPLLWWVLIAGAILVSGFSILFGAESFVAHSLKACMIVALITMLLFSIYALNHPFTGMVHVSPDPLQQTLVRFAECDSGLMD